MFIKSKNNKREIRLREKCVEYVLRFSPYPPGMATRIEDLIRDSQVVYEFITAGELKAIGDRRYNRNREL